MSGSLTDKTIDICRLRILLEINGFQIKTITTEDDVGIFHLADEETKDPLPYLEHTAIERIEMDKTNIDELTLTDFLSQCPATVDCSADVYLVGSLVSDEKTSKDIDLVISDKTNWFLYAGVLMKALNPIFGKRVDVFWGALDSANRLLYQNGNLIP